jgi:type II secretory pathway pseudopilin PulG
VTGRRESGDADEGTTLLELLLTIAIMGIAVATIVGGAMTAVVGSDANHKQADISSAVRAFADDVVALPYQACLATYSPPYVAPAGLTASITAVEYWDSPTSAFLSTCPASDFGYERLTLLVASVDGRASETVQVEKRAQVTGQTP